MRNRMIWWRSCGIGFGLLLVGGLVLGAAGPDPADDQQVRIVRPRPGQVISGPVEVSVRVGLAVKQVTIVIDNAIRYMSNLQPFNYVWSTATALNGPHVIQAKAYDEEDGEWVSVPVPVVVNNPGGMTKMQVKPAAPVAEQPPSAAKPGSQTAAVSPKSPAVAAKVSQPAPSTPGFAAKASPASKPAAIPASRPVVRPAAVVTARPVRPPAVKMAVSRPVAVRPAPAVKPAPVVSARIARPVQPASVKMAVSRPVAGRRLPVADHAPATSAPMAQATRPASVTVAKATPVQSPPAVSAARPAVQPTARPPEPLPAKPVLMAQAVIAPAKRQENAVLVQVAPVFSRRPALVPAPQPVIAKATEQNNTRQSPAPALVAMIPGPVQQAAPRPPEPRPAQPVVAAQAVIPLVSSQEKAAVIPVAPVIARKPAVTQAPQPGIAKAIRPAEPPQSPAPAVVAMLPRPPKQAGPSPLVSPETSAPEVYLTKSGDTLYSIAFEHGVGVEELARVNRLGDSSLIYPGQRLWLPKPLTLAVEGREIEPTVLPRLVKGVATGPFRQLVELVGGLVDWSSRLKTASASLGGRRLEVTLGKRQARVDNRPVALAVPARVSRGRMVVPLRLLEEAFGFSLDYQQERRRISLSK